MKGRQLNLQDFVRLLRSRWLIICVTIAVAVAGSRRGHVAHDSALPGLDEALCVDHVRRIRKRDIPGHSVSPNSA